MEATVLRRFMEEDDDEDAFDGMDIPEDQPLSIGEIFSFSFRRKVHIHSIHSIAKVDTILVRANMNSLRGGVLVE